MTKLFKNINDLPIVLTADDVKTALNISRAGAYNLMNRREFPSLRIGKRILVSKEDFIRWMETTTRTEV